MSDATDDPYAPQPLTRWFTAGAIGSLLVMLAAVALYFAQVTVDPAQLPLDERAAYDAKPAWETALYAIGAWVGLAGAVLLLMRRKLAETLLLIALVAIIAWIVGIFAVPGLRAVVGADDAAMLAILAALYWTVFWFARHSRMRGWLR